MAGPPAGSLFLFFMAQPTILSFGPVGHPRWPKLASMNYIYKKFFKLKIFLLFICYYNNLIFINPFKYHNIYFK